MRNLALLLGPSLLAVTVGAAVVPCAPCGTFYVDAESRAQLGHVRRGTAVVASQRPLRDTEPSIAERFPGAHIVVTKAGAFGPIYLTGSIAIAGPEDKSLQIINSGAAPGCIGAAPGTCAATTTAAIEINAASTDQIKLKNILVSAGEFRFGRHP